jgi:hypothetical protein
VLKAWKGRKKPVMGLVAGFTEKSGEVMGHAGAVRMFGDVEAAAKVRALEDAGAVVVTHPGQFGEGMLKLLGRRRPPLPVKGMGPDGPRRGYHTVTSPRTSPPVFGTQQRRRLHLQAAKAAGFIGEVYEVRSRVGCINSLLAARTRNHTLHRPTYLLGLHLLSGNLHRPRSPPARNSNIY